MLEGQCTITCCEAVCLHTHPLQQIHKQIAERRVTIFVVSNVTSVLVAATGKNDWEIRRIMSVGITQIAAKKYSCVIKQPSSLG